MALHEALLNGMPTSLSRAQQLSSPLRPNGGSSPGNTFPHGFVSSIPLGLNLFKNPRPNVLHASGGGRGGFHPSSGHSMNQTGMHYSSPSFAEVIRSPNGKFANPLFNPDQGMNLHLEYQEQGWDYDTLFPPSNIQNLHQGASSPTDNARGEQEAEKIQHLPPKAHEMGTDADLDSVIINNRELEAWYSQLQERVVIGLCHGPRPSMEVLKQWISVNWENRNVFPQQIQYLPNNFYLFSFEDTNSALQVITGGQWLIKNTPISFFKWFKGFNPKREKPTKIPVWVDFPDLLVEYYPWLSKIGGAVGKVLGQKARGTLNGIPNCL
ncbi:hypothetical protein L7F22_025959 [Adiantum nelumboides]|nr:hypothetical protein [Adiantum nelumboides]